MTNVYNKNTTEKIITEGLFTFSKKHNAEHFQVFGESKI